VVFDSVWGVIPPPPERNTAWNKRRKCFHCLGAPNNWIHPWYRRLGGPHSRSGEVRKISPPTGIRSPDRPARSESLYRLNYPSASQVLCLTCFREIMHRQATINEPLHVRHLLPIKDVQSPNSMPCHSWPKYQSQPPSFHCDHYSRPHTWRTLLWRIVGTSHRNLLRNKPEI